ncbi:hypothetical protein PHAVU_L001981 [Phaseolus vulgaris]|uniref:Uncharacterized protein n=2 Tax=Phaseolus vulgaris TaxID=3885 RepID=A0ACC3P000_PHAVU|nr:hypothetical protein PHAVU_010G109400g [Phaseolus vulgaris]ESW07193.1 hypothetical protein PHAVU_010G109400g [Phaseolus vulgaris]
MAAPLFMVLNMSNIYFVNVYDNHEIPFSRDVSSTLRSRSKIHFINDTLLRPPSWFCNVWPLDRCNFIVLSWVCWMDTIVEMYNTLQMFFQYRHLFTRLQNLWEDLDQFLPLPSCSCEIKYSCNLIPTIPSYRDGDCILCFLKGLNEQYLLIRSQITMMQSLPDLNHVFSFLIYKERHFGVLVDDPRTLVYFPSSTRGRGGSGVRSQPSSTSDRGRGHV